MSHSVSDPSISAEPIHARIWSPPYLRLTLGLTLLVSCTAIEALAVATALPALVKDLGGLNLYGWAFSAFLLANLMGIVVAGEMADRRGLALPFLVGIGMFDLGLLLAGASPTMPCFVFSRAVQGFGAGLLASFAYVSIARCYPDQAKARMLAVLSSAWVVPGLAGPAAAAAIVLHFGWRWIFWGLAPLVVIAGLLTLPALVNLRPVTIPPADYRRIGLALRLTLGASLLFLGSWAKSLLAVLAALVGLALALPALARLLPEGSLRARPGIPAAIVTTGLLNLAFFGVDAFVPLALTRVRAQSLTVVGLTLTAATIAWTGGAWIQAHLAARKERRRLALIGLLLISVGIVGIALMLSPALPAITAVGSWAIAGLGMGLAYSTTKLVVLENVPANQEGSISASMQLADVLGAAIGTGFSGVLVGSAVSRNGTPRTGLLLVDLLTLLVLGLAFVSASRLPNRTNRLET